jgi:hypothetical protein
MFITLARDAGGHVIGASLRRYEYERSIGPGVQQLDKLRIEEKDCESKTSTNSPTSAFPLIKRAYGQTGQRPRSQSLSDVLSQSDLKNPEVVRRLFSIEDPFVRRRARDELAQQGVDAIPVIQILLRSPNYSVQLGSLVALGKLPQSVRAQVPADIWQAASALEGHSDPTMQEAARYALRR